LGQTLLHIWDEISDFWNKNLGFPKFICIALKLIAYFRPVVLGSPEPFQRFGRGSLN